MQSEFDLITFDFHHLQKKHKNIKEMQNHIEWENADMREKFKKLEEIVLAYGKENNNL